VTRAPDGMSRPIEGLAKNPQLPELSKWIIICRGLFSFALIIDISIGMLICSPLRRTLVTILFVLSFFYCRFTLGDESSELMIPAGAEVDVNQAGLHALDWGLIALYAVATIGLGLYFSRRQRSTAEYFVGSGSMNPFFVGVSIFATLLSTISYLSMPGEAAGKGPVSVLSNLLVAPLVYVIVAFWILPVYMRKRVTSAYALLEDRLGLSIRLFGATMFLALRLVWMTLLVYLSAKALTVMMGVDPKWIPLIVLVTGLVSVIYTTMGGLQAVIVTDFMQTCLLFGGALLVILTVSWEFGGLDWFPTTWHPQWDIQPIYSFDPKTRVTIVGTFCSMLVWHVATAGGDQTAVQRFMATRDVRDARRAVFTQMVVSVVVSITLLLVGFALLSYFEASAGRLPAGMDIKADADDLFPHYISHHLPMGVSGLVVAAMFAAAMSSIDSGVNSVTAVVMTDFLDRFGWKPKTEKGHVRVARLLALGIGTIVVLGSSYMGYIPGNISAVTNKTVNLLSSPIFALFFFALFVRRASATGVWIGVLLGIVTAVAIAFSGPIVYELHTKFGVDPASFNVEVITGTDPVSGESWKTCSDPISFQWIGPLSLVVSIAAGMLACMIFPRRESLHE